MNNALALILAGGQAKRMGRLCRENQKPTLPIAGNSRIIDFCLTNCLSSGLKEIAIINSDHDDSIARYLGDRTVAGSRWPATLLPPKNGGYTGTADAVWQNAPFIRKQKCERILILAADHVYKMDYNKFFQFHRSVKADLSIAVARVPFKEVYRYGIVTTDAGDRVLGFREKPFKSSSNLASMGIYIFNKSKLLKVLAQDALNSYSPHDFAYSIIPEMIARDRVFAYRFNGYWRDIGTVESYYRTNLELIDKILQLRANKGLPDAGHADDSFYCCDRSGERRIIHSLISPGCTIKGTVINSVLSPDVVVNEHAVVKNSVVMSSVNIGEYSQLEGCLVENNVSIGGYCCIGIKDKLRNHREFRITILGSNVIVPSYTFISHGENVIGSKSS